MVVPSTRTVQPEFAPSKDALSDPLSDPLSDLQMFPSTTAESSPGLPGSNDPLHRFPVQGQGPLAGKSAGAHAAAGHGVQGSGGTLPFLDTIQASFGDHDLSGVQAFRGGAATAANESLGSDAYATGNNVAFKSNSPDLHTAAHEAAHTVQQQAGVQLSGGVGQVGDSYERQADAVADRVVQGRFAVDLLPAGGGGGGEVQMSGGSVQFAGGDKYVPDGASEPHLHIHKGGVTFTSVGHRHKNLRAGEEVRQGAINEVIAELREDPDDERGQTIIEWIENNIAEADDSESNEVGELKDMLEKWSGFADMEGRFEIQLPDGKGGMETKYLNEIEELKDWSEEIEAYYKEWIDFQAEQDSDEREFDDDDDAVGQSKGEMMHKNRRK